MRLTPLHWGWTCNATWKGLGNSFTLTVPANKSNLIIQGMRFNKQFNEIECWGYFENNNIGSQYKDDISSPEGSPCSGRRPCDGGTDGTGEPRKSKEYLE